MGSKIAAWTLPRRSVGTDNFLLGMKNGFTVEGTFVFRTFMTF